MKNKTLDFITEIKADENSKEFEAYASTFGNTDYHNDVILPGAFQKSILKRKPKLAYQHNTQDLCGVIKDIYEDSKGLYVKGQFIDTPTGNKAYVEVKSGAINQMSIGFALRDYDYDKDGVRLIKQVDLYEVSFVTFPANELATVQGIKANDINNIRDFERALRDMGFSKEKAVAIASGGFKSGNQSDSDAQLNNTESDSEIDEVKTIICELTNQLKGFTNGKKLF